METSTASACKTCHKLEKELQNPLKLCAKCRITSYCSRECQKEDWKSHKRVCALMAPSHHDEASTSHQARAATNSTTGPHNPGFHAANQFLRLSDDKYLHRFSEADAFTQLIDCFRLRCTDEYNFSSDYLGVYRGDPRPDYRRFLDLAETRDGLLPPWWNAQKREQCEEIGYQTSGWADISSAVRKDDIMDHYGDILMPMKLRVLGEKIYGRGFQ